MNGGRKGATAEETAAASPSNAAAAGGSKDGEDVDVEGAVALLLDLTASPHPNTAFYAAAAVACLAGREVRACMCAN